MIGGKNTIKNSKIQFNILKSSHREYIDTFPINNKLGLTRDNYLVQKTLKIMLVSRLVLLSVADLPCFDYRTQIT